MALSAGAIVGAQSSLSSRVYASGLSFPAAFVQDPTDARVQFVVQPGASAWCSPG